MPPIKNLPADASSNGADGADGKAEGSAQDEERKGSSILVRSVSDKGRRRAGYAFTPEPQRIFLEDLTEDQKDSIKADKQLVSRLFDDD